jgi:hypothetical protein
MKRKDMHKPGTWVYCHQGNNKYACGLVMSIPWRWGWKYRVQHAVDSFQCRGYFDIAFLYHPNQVSVDLPAKGGVVRLYAENLYAVAKNHPQGWFGK